MFKDTIDVGIDGFKVTLSVDMPETEADVAILSKGNAGYRVAKFIRGYRIDLQEGGARQAVRELCERTKRPLSVLSKDEAFIAEAKKVAAAEIDAFNPDAPRSRGGRPAKPVVLTAADMATIAASENQAEAMAAILRAQGIRLEITKG